MNQSKPLFLFFFLIAFIPFPSQAQTLNHHSHHQKYPHLRQLQSCELGCLTCSSSEVCSNCDSTRVLIDGKCRCESPRILVTNNCEYPWYMTENPTTQECEYIDIIDVAYFSPITVTYDAVFQAQINPMLKWTDPPTFTWTLNCNYANSQTQDQLMTYLSTQQTDILRIPSNLLEVNLDCSGKVSYSNQNALEISKIFSFEVFNTTQPQIHIVGGPFQIFTHTDVNLIQAEVVSISCFPIPLYKLEIIWSQTGGDETLDMSQLYNSSNPLRLTIPKCTLSPGKLYTFKLSVKLKITGDVVSQEVTVGVHSPKISLQAIQTDSYHLYNQDLKLTASGFSIPDECNQGISPTDFLDLSTAEYVWECAIVDLYYNDSRLLIAESTDITDDLNVRIHPDPQHLFYTSTASQTLTIPSSYFSRYQGYQFIFYLTANVQSKSITPSITNFNLLQPTLYTPQTKAFVRILTSKPFTTVSFNCVNENNCQAFSDDWTRLTGFNYNPNLTYTWTFNVFSAQSTILSYNNWATIYSIYPRTPTQKLLPQIMLQVTDGTNVASSFFTLPLQSPFQKGSLYIYPSSGEAYNTNFFVSTYLNQNDDLPVSFQFYTFCNGVNHNYLLPKYEPFDFTPILLPPGSGSTCNIGVEMTPNLGLPIAMSNLVPLTGGCTSLSDVIQKNIQAMDSSKSFTDIYRRLRLISLMLDNLQVWEDNSDDKVSYVTSAQFKYSAISEMRDIFQILGPKAGVRLIMLNNLYYASNQLFNQDGNWELYMSILDEFYQASSSQGILNPDEYRLFATILDNMIYYMKKPGNEIEDPDKVFTYVNTLVRSTLSPMLPTDTNGFNYDGTFYSLLTLRVTYCQVLQNVVTVPFYAGMTANFTVRPGQTIPPEKCNSQADFIWLAFRGNYTVPSRRGEYRTLIYLDLRDSITGKSLLEIFSFYLNSTGVFCPNSIPICGSNGQGGTTIYGVFDLKNQIYKIFGKSNIDQIVNVSALQDFKFWKSSSFWTVVVFSIWFVISFYWLWLKHPTYCALLANRTISQKRFYIKTNFLFWLAHPLIGIYLYNNPKTTKATRLALYYQRLAVVMVFSTLFSSTSKGEGVVFRAYLILFNACTVIPTNSLLNRVFGWAFELKISPKSFASYTKGLIVILFFLIFLAACFIAVFIIQAQQDKSQNITWGVNFAISLLQDFTLAPLISMTLKILLVKFAQSRRTIKLKRMRRFINFLLPTFKSIYNSIFANILIPIETQAPTATEIASPMSTSRKLLKETTPDLPSPILPSSPRKRVFRTRRLSESGMANVDEKAVETLITDRFQTVFSEGKTLRVKENSPVKENYSRMQSANISSAKLSRLGNSKGLSLNWESKFINRTSIVLSPTGPSPELAMEIGPVSGFFTSSETLQGTNSSILKLLKDGRLFGSSIFSNQTQERLREGRPVGSSLYQTQDRIKGEKTLGSVFFSTQEKIKDEKGSGSGGASAQENVKKPFPFV